MMVMRYDKASLATRCRALLSFCETATKKWPQVLRACAAFPLLLLSKGVASWGGLSAPAPDYSGKLVMLLSGWRNTVQTH